MKNPFGMRSDMTVIGIILSAGIGSRMNIDTPKQYLHINGVELLSYSVDAFRSSTLIDSIVVVVDSEESAAHVQDTYDVDVTLGGSTRNESFLNALDYISEHFPECTKVVVNEAARPLITSKIIDDFVRLLDSNSVVYCIKDITDSLETNDGHFVDRRNFKLVMSPEGYDFRVIRNYFSSDSETTFPGHTVPDGYSKHGYREYPNNIKVTYMTDIVLVSELLKARGHVD